MTPRQASKDSEAGKKRLQGRHDYVNQRQARKDSFIGRQEKTQRLTRKDSKADKKLLQGRKEKTPRQPRNDSKAGNEMAPRQTRNRQSMHQTLNGKQ
jgi:hypothetical protein